MIVTDVARPRGLLAVLLSGQMMVSMDGSIVAVALPSISEDLGASGALLQLVTAGYILALAVLVVTGARLGDLYGHRRVFFRGLFGFTIASLACGLAPTGGALVGARICQGAAAAFVLPQVLSLIQLRFDGWGRARAMGLYSMILALGVAFGQAAGGVLVTLDLFGAGWRPIFLVNVPIGALLLTLGRRFAPPDTGHRTAPLDIVGVVILSAGMAAFVVPLVLGREQGWPAWTWLCMAAGLGGLIAFGMHETRTASPLLDLGVLRTPGVKPGLFACYAVMGAYTGLLFTLALHLQNGLDFSPLRAGLAFLPYTAGFAIMGLGWARLPDGARRPLPVIGLLSFAAAASALVAAMDDGWPSVLSIPLLVIAGAGHAAGFSPLVDRIARLAGPDRASAVSALANTGTLLSEVLAIAVLGGVYLAAAESRLGLVHVALLLAPLLALAALGARRAVSAPYIR